MKNIWMIVFLLMACKMPYSKQNIQANQASFPEDEGVHIKNSLEWWYFTGHLRDSVKGKTFGIEYVVFHVNPTSLKGSWVIHAALSDPETQDFHYTSKYIHKSKYEFQGIPIDFQWDRQKISSKFNGLMGEYEVEVKTNDFSYQLKIQTSKGLLLHDSSGYENYGGYARAGYYSFPRLEAEGKLKLNGEEYNLSGDLWYDRQWNCSGVFNRNIGWDWFAIQLDSPKTEIMVYRLFHHKDGRKVLGGSIFGPEGDKRTLSNENIKIEEVEYWESPESNRRYPVLWRLSIAEHIFTVEAAFEGQELSMPGLPFKKLYYWEGMSLVEGEYRGIKVEGNAYVELTNRR